jgi:hypothetical protein
MYFFVVLLVVSTTALINGKKLECEYSSREYQIVLKPELVSGTNSFAYGVSLVLDELSAIEKAAVLDFKVSRSSLKFKNVTSIKYYAQNVDDLQFKITMKSRQKAFDAPADFVLKFSNSDPTLACIPLKIADIYSKYAEDKFELDLHALNGKVMTKSAMSYSVDMPSSLRFSQFAPVNVSSIFVNAANKLTHSGRPIIAQSVGTAVQLTAEFEIRIFGGKFKASIILLDMNDSPRAEFSFRIKGTDVDENILITAQKVASELSRISSIALFAEASTICPD